MPNPSIPERITAAPHRELCSSELTWDPWVHDARPEEPRSPLYGPGASQWDAIPASAPVQIEIPERYRRMPDQELAHRIAVAKATLGSQLVTLGHHYQRDEIIRWADFRGDSFKLSQQAAARKEAACIVFCGGTEINMVNRLAAEHPDKLIFCLDPVICPCSTMYRIHPAYLAWVLEALVEGQVLNEIAVPDRVKAAARVALDRMLCLPGQTQPAMAPRMEVLS